MKDNGGGECTRKRDGAGTGTGGNIRIFWNGYPLGRGDYEYDDKWHTVFNIKDYEQTIERSMRRWGMQDEPGTRTGNGLAMMMTSGMRNTEQVRNTLGGRKNLLT